MTNSVTIELDGTLSPTRFARLATDFAKILDELTKERDASGRVAWAISDLEFGSAIMSAAASALDPKDDPLVHELVDAYMDHARHAHTHPDDIGRPVLKLIHGLREDAAHGAHDLTLSVGDAEVVLNPPGVATVPPFAKLIAFGTIRGRVETLQHRRGLRFVLYELNHDTPVKCYVSADKADLIRDMWGHIVEVTGLVARDPASGYPKSIRQITHVQKLDEHGDPYGFRRARGAGHPRPGSPPAEVLTRQARDAI